jgi:hypothetical protein
MRAVKKATSGAIEGVEWALGKQLLACARPKLRPPLPACLPADLFSSNLTRYDFESHDHRPNVRHPRQQPQSTDCLFDDVRSFSQIRLDFGPLRKLDRCSKAHGVFRLTCWRLGYLYSTYSGAGRCGVIPSLSRYFVCSCLSVSALSVAPSLRPPSSSLPPSVTSSVFPRLRSVVLALVVVSSLGRAFGPCSLPARRT